MIFGLGLSRTGTKSLNSALNILGYNSCHHPAISRAFGGRHSKKTVKNFKRKLFDKYNAYTDTPILLIINILPKLYPDAKYIVTTREIEQWAESCINFFGGKPVPRSHGLRKTRKLLYGTDLPIKKMLLIKSHNKWYRVINKFVKDKNYVTIDCSENSDVKWDKICKFLSVDVPDCPYPHVNKIRKKKHNPCHM